MEAKTFEVMSISFQIQDLELLVVTHMSTYFCNLVAMFIVSYLKFYENTKHIKVDYDPVLNKVFLSRNLSKSLISYLYQRLECDHKHHSL